ATWYVRSGLAGDPRRAHVDRLQVDEDQVGALGHGQRNCFRAISRNPADGDCRFLVEQIDKRTRQFRVTADHGGSVALDNPSSIARRNMTATRYSGSRQWVDVRRE